MDMYLTLDELETLLSIVSNEMEMCSFDAPDYTDVSLMEYYTNRATAYAKIKETLEGLN